MKFLVYSFIVIRYIRDSRTFEVEERPDCMYNCVIYRLIISLYKPYIISKILPFLIFNQIYSSKHFALRVVKYFTLHKTLHVKRYPVKYVVTVNFYTHVR